MGEITLIAITIYVVTTIIIVLVLNLIQNKRNKDIKKELDKLDYEKNMIDSSPIVPELSKIESLKRNDKLEVMYKDWKERLNNIKSEQIPKITDMLLEADYSLSQLNYKDTLYKIAKLEMEIYKVRTNSEMLLNDIKEITMSEERHRATITKLKAKYRELYQKFLNTRHEYGEIAKSVSMQFENIAKQFEVFEKIMEAQEYTEVPKVVEVIDEMLKHMAVVIEEMPSIVLLATNILPNKIKEIGITYNRLLSMGYPLDYLNIEYNVEEAFKKIDDIMERSKVLNMEESLFELKVLLEYFDSVFNDFEKEKINRQTYEDTIKNFNVRINKMNTLVADIFDQIESLHNLYNLSNEDIVLLNEIREDLKNLNSDYKVLMGHIGNNTFAYSKLIVEVENLNIRLTTIEDRLDNSLDTIGSMREDEMRARQQLEEVKNILKESKNKIREYNLPVIPNSYYVELSEAQAAIKEIVRELDKKPITIEVLNTRVDTARDLVLKLFSKTKEIIKNAKYAEMAIVYGNRYRATYDGLDKFLSYSENLFFKGDYKKSLELTISSLNKIDPDIYKKLSNLENNM